MQPEGKAEFPSQFGRYTLVERLATGGMAEVFRAKIVSTHGFEKPLVIKRILPHLAADKTFVSMFIDEAKLTATLVHPKIVQVIDFGEVSGQYFIALEFVEGFDALALLRTSAQRQVRLPIPICMFITMEVLDALDFAHNALGPDGKPMRIVHRDISPSNVFISRRGDVKLGDFGIAHAQERESKTQAGTLKGKYGYMSPEQVVGASLDGRSDIFAVGIVLAEMLMGRRLFTAPNDLDVLLMVRDGRLDRLDKYCKDIPPELDVIVRKSLKKKVTERYQTAAEFRDALGDLLFQFGIRIGPPDLSRVAQDYFDPSPEALVRLKEQARRWKVHQRPTGVIAAVSTGVGEALTPPPVAATPISNVAAQKAEWGVVTPPVAHQAPAASAAAGFRPSGTAEIQVDIDDAGPSAHAPAAAPPPASAPKDPGILAALDQALSQPLSVVDLDAYTEAAPGSPSAAPGPGSGAVVAASGPAPDAAGDLAVLSPMRVFSDLAVAGETGLLRLEFAGIVKDVYLVRGAPESLNSNQPADRFGEYLVARGFLRAADLEAALLQSGKYGGKLGDTLVGMGVMKPLDVFRLLSQQVRERVMELFAWVQGSFAYFRGVRNPVEGFPLGLDSFEILGASVLTLPYEFLQARFQPLGEFRPRAVPQPRINPDAFKLGGSPREVWTALDGRRTLREWASRFSSPSDLLTFLRLVYLLLETDLARLE